MKADNFHGVSFIICTLVYKETLQKVLDSINLHKTNADEVILVVNKTNQGEFPDKFLAAFDKVLFNPVLGVSVSRNLGIRNSKHDFIAFLDDDTVLPSGWRSILHFLDKYNSVSLVQCQTEAIFQEHYKANVLNNRFIMFDVAGSIIRKTALESIGGFDEKFIRCEDIDLASRLYFNGWDFSFSNLQISDLEKKNIVRSFRDMFLSSKFEARVLKKTLNTFESSILVLFFKLLMDFRNKMRLKRFKFLHTYYCLKKIEDTGPYRFGERLLSCLVIVGQNFYRLRPDARLVFFDDTINIYGLNCRNVGYSFNLSRIKIKSDKKSYYMEVDPEDFYYDEKLFFKV